MVAASAPRGAAAAEPTLRVPLDLATRAPLLHRAGDTGISIVRMPPRASGGGSSTIPANNDNARLPSKPGPSVVQPQGRHIKLTAKVGSQSGDPTKGWLGVNMELVELPLALSLGLANADGALILSAAPGGPAAQAGLRFGDILVGLNGRALANVGEVRQRIAALPPGSEAALEAWRIAADEGEFLQMLRRLADSGNAHVMYRLGRLYAAGSGVIRDETQAMQWFRKSADAGNAQAMTALAAALLDARGSTANDQQEALRLLRAAADKDSIEAMYRLAHILLEGRIANKDALEAARLFTRASDAGHAPSMVDLGRMYANGTGVQVDAAKAAMLYRQAADLGNTAGMVNLGWLYEHGKGVETDVAKALQLYRRAVDLNNSGGMVNLALLYANGKGVDKNEAAAVQLYRRAIGYNNSMAMNNLAWMLQGGRGVERKEPEEAADLMMKALDRRNEFSRQRMTQFSNGWSREFRQAMQRRLRDAGFYSGSIDGNFRDSTIAAIDAYFNRPR